MAESLAVWQIGNVLLGTLELSLLFLEIDRITIWVRSFRKREERDASCADLKDFPVIDLVAYGFEKDDRGIFFPGRVGIFSQNPTFPKADLPPTEYTLGGEPPFKATMSFTVNDNWTWPGDPYNKGSCVLLESWIIQKPGCPEVPKDDPLLVDSLGNPHVKVHRLS